VTHFSLAVFPPPVIVYQLVLNLTKFLIFYFQISKSLLCLKGHKMNVELLDFHPTMDVLCSSFTSDVTALWNLKEGVMFKILEVSL
jgi:hypothetical protein